LVAAVRGVNPSATQNNYMIEDGTGVTDAKKYSSDPDDTEELGNIV
jgi:hypothetical protein